MQAADTLLRGGVPGANILYATFDHPILKLAGIDVNYQLTASAIAPYLLPLGLLLGYLLHQGWGNRPEAFKEALPHLERALQQPGSDDHDAAITHLLHFHQWHYVWPTEPALVVLDSRTHRWRSDLSSRQPSGLLDWESLTDLQHTLLDREAVLLVSSAPIFGVKLIETLQHLFSWAGSPLVVDAENWMGHPGAASAILNIFRHPRTPQHFVVLSGDVHYSFVYDVKLRRRTRLRTGARSPDIWQICSSGLRNTFPGGLLAVLDHGNRWLYSPRSPLNWFTRRRHLRVVPRKPEGLPHGRRLLDASGVGLVELDEHGRPWRIRRMAKSFHRFAISSASLSFRQRTSDCS